MSVIRPKDALDYHSQGRKGKIEVVATKPCITQRDLSLAYSPGVAEPCLEIQKDPDKAYEYTAKGNLVAVISNGTAVLGLGNIGALAGKPVMEGKGVLFKRFADIDVFDIEVDTEDPEELINLVRLLEPTFGGINLEDIKAPECFIIEQRLKELMNIPVFHDDQHGTAIISGAAFINALELVGKKARDVKIVFSGAGASANACANFYISLGAKLKNIIMVDSKGVIYKGRKKGMNPYKEKFARDTKLRTLEDAMKGADVFAGLSTKGLVTKKMVKSMADKPIVFAMANPDPEISYEDALDARSDVIMATGRSDYPNQVNNVLGFPFIFRGALDVRARAINEEMKIAASKALAALAKEDVPEYVSKAYDGRQFKFGPEYIIPKPFDSRVLLWVAPAVARAAIESGVAQSDSYDDDTYIECLEKILGRTREIMRPIMNKAKSAPKRIVFPEGDHEPVLRAAQTIIDEGIGKPILLGDVETIREKVKALDLEINGAEIIDPAKSGKNSSYVKKLYKMRQRKGLDMPEAKRQIRNRTVFGLMMLHQGDADGVISGATQSYPETIRPGLQIIGIKKKVHKVSGLYMMLFKERVLFLSDTTVNIDPTAEDLADIALSSAEAAKFFGIKPVVAMLSFSNFGSVKHPLVDRVRRATEIVKKRNPKLMVDGDMQADTAVVQEIAKEAFPFCLLKKPANVLIFPDLASGNIAYKLLQRVGGAEAIGPILLGMKKPVNVLQRGAPASEIVNMTAITTVEAQTKTL